MSLSFAGLYTERPDAEGVPLKTLTIITAEPNSLVAEVHNRMPVVSARADEKAWLEGSGGDRRESLDRASRRGARRAMQLGKQIEVSVAAS